MPVLRAVLVRVPCRSRVPRRCGLSLLPSAALEPLAVPVPSVVPAVPMAP